MSSNNLNDKESGAYTTHIITEFRATYYEIMRNRLHFEIWTWNTWGLNRFLGIKSLSLLDVVNGSINREVFLSKPVGKRMDGVANLSLKVKFEEIWDFSITMLDWHADDLKRHDANQSRDTVDSFCRVTLTSGTKDYSSTNSITVKNDFSPNWTKFESGLRFRGTYNQLLSQKAYIRFYRANLIGSTKFGEKMVNLRSFLLTNILKTEVLIHK